MSYTIAVCGKGGTGKTTLTGLIIRHLLKKHGDKSILAVDADPNANLDAILGVKSDNSIVAIADDIAQNPDQVPAGTTKDRYLEYQIQEALVEAEGFDLLTMGRPEGPGCYCYVNNLLRTLLTRLKKSYAYVVIDNEAGMEHLSRRTARKMDLLLIISDYSLVGLRSAKRILDLAKELKLNIGQARLIVNRAPAEINALKKEIEQVGIPLGGIVPEDKAMAKLSLGQANARTITEQSPAIKAMDKICQEAINGS